MIRKSKPSYQLTRALKSTLSKEDILGKFPFLDGGWEETELPGDIHSLMLTYYVLLGQDLGYSSMIDKSVYDELHRKVTSGDTRKNTAPVADSAWYEPETSKLRCLVEFQSWSGSSDDREKIIQKAKNMILYDDMRPDLELIVLHHWDVSNKSVPDKVLQILREGFSDEDDVTYSPPNADVVIVKSRFHDSSRGVQLQYTAFKETIPGMTV